jgi:soluble lytic murein transglycosylase-like protein
MAYDTAEDERLHPNTTFVQPQALPVDRSAPTLSPPGQAPPSQAEYDASRIPPPRNAVPPWFNEPDRGMMRRDPITGGDPSVANQQQADATSKLKTEIVEEQYGARGSPPSGVDTTQSEPTPAVKTPPINPVAYQWISENNPKLKETIDKVSELTGTSRERLAAYGWVESRFNANAPRGAKGEIGMMQMLPSTAADINRKNNTNFNPAVPEEAVMLAGLYSRQLDADYGKDSVNSIRHYNGSGSGTWDYMQKNHSGYKILGDFQYDPQTVAAVEKQARGGSTNAKGLVESGVKGGPEGFLRYSVQTAPSGMPLTDVWRHAEDALVRMFLIKGDLAGAQHAKDFVLQMSHAGSNQNLMQAHQLLSAGDGVGAAHALAKAHAFFPDGTIGRFKSDGRNVYAERLDENDPSKKVGPGFQVTPDGIASLLNQTRSPQQFLKTMNEQQKATSESRYKQAHGDYWAQLTGSREAIATKGAEATIEAAKITAEATERAAAAKGPSGEMVRAATKTADAIFNDPTKGELEPLEKRAMLSQLAADAIVQSNGAMTGTQAERIARGLSDGTLGLIGISGGRHAVGHKDNRKQPIAYLSKQVGDAWLAQQQPAPQAPVSPIGAGAATTGTPPTLAGTSAAMPVGTR